MHMQDSDKGPHQVGAGDFRKRGRGIRGHRRGVTLGATSSASSSASPSASSRASSSWGQRGDDLRRTCAACHSPENLILDDADSIVVFCRDCAAPMSALEFPEYYCDLGGGD